jgi:hypothetical protein
MWGDVARTGAFRRALVGHNLLVAHGRARRERALPSRIATVRSAVAGARSLDRSSRCSGRSQRLAPSSSRTVAPIAANSAPDASAWGWRRGASTAFGKRAGPGRLGFIRGGGASQSAFMVATAELRHMTPAVPAGPAPRRGHADGSRSRAASHQDRFSAAQSAPGNGAPVSASSSADRAAWPTRERARRACRRHVAQRSCRHHESKSGCAIAADDPQPARPCPHPPPRMRPHDPPGPQQQQQHPLTPAPSPRRPHAG